MSRLKKYGLAALLLVLTLLAHTLEYRDLRTQECARQDRTYDSSTDTCH